MKKTSPHDEKATPEVLEQALLLACQRIADSAQTYEEANTAEGWCEVFIQKAESEKKTEPLKM